MMMNWFLQIVTCLNFVKTQSMFLYAWGSSKQFFQCKLELELESLSIFNIKQTAKTWANIFTGRFKTLLVSSSADKWLKRQQLVARFVCLSFICWRWNKQFLKRLVKIFAHVLIRCLYSYYFNLAFEDDHCLMPQHFTDLILLLCTEFISVKLFSLNVAMSPLSDASTLVGVISREI